MEADMDLMEEILASVDWKSGIRPLGNLATEACFVQKEMPIIKRLAGNLSTSLLVTQSSWTSNLVDTGVISNLNDDTTMHALSELHLLFHTRQQQPGHRTLHHLHLDSQAYFSVNHILRPTIKFQKALEAALGHMHEDQDRAWQELCKVWHDFGFLWPQKIILGHRHHVKHSYQVRTDSERVYQLQVARDHTSALLDMELRKSQSKEKTRKSVASLQTASHDTHHITGHHQAPIIDTEWLRQNSTSWKVIRRDDIRPIYEFLPTPMRDPIRRLIQIFVHRIPLNQPFMLRSVSTNGYLSWRTNPKQQQQQQHHTPTTRAHDSGYDNSTSTQSTAQSSNEDHQQIASTLFSTISLDMMKTTNSFCIWKFSDSSASSSRQAPFSTKATPRKYVRCGSQLYLQPNMHPSINKDIILTRSTSASSATSSSITDNSLQPRVWDLFVEKASRVRSVEFLEKYALTHESSSQHQWTVETPDLGLDMDDDFSTDGHLNVDIAIGRQKPILNQEIISLRQILYLCSVHNQISYSPSTQLRRSVNNPSQSPPIVIPSPVPPGAAGVMAMIRKISSDNDDDDLIFSHPSTSVARSDSKRKNNSTTASSTSHLNSATSNTSVVTLPYYNLHTYTVLPPPLVTASTVSVSLSPTLTYPSSLSASPSQHSFNPVLAKEHSLISGPEESYWVIELLPDGGGDPTNLGRMNTNSNNIALSLNEPLNQGKQKHAGPAMSHSVIISNTTKNWQRKTTGLMRLKMVMSSDTLRDDAMSEMADSPSHHGSYSTMRRVQSYSSVHDSHYLHQQQQQQQQQQCHYHHVSLPGLDGQEDNNGGINTIVNINQHGETIATTRDPLSPMVSSSSPLSPIPQQYTAAPNIQPYLRLYASKQNNKTWSHFIKHSTLANLKRWLRTE